VEALDRVDQNRVKRLARSFAIIRDELIIAEIKQDPFDQLRQADLVHVLHAVETYRELLNELDKSEVSLHLIKHQNKLRQILSRSVIPEIDGYIVSERELDRIITLVREQEGAADARLGREYLEKLVAADILELEDDETDPTLETSAKKDFSSILARRLKKIAAGLGTATGGLMMASNLGLAVLSGVLSTLPTIAPATVPPVVGILASLGGGATLVGVSLKDLASVIDDSKNSK
jgi:hypothetical protein